MFNYLYSFFLLLEFVMKVVAALAGILGVVLLAIAVVVVTVCGILCRRKLMKRRRSKLWL